jgi:tRNA 2-thiouridine synthesizing protein A
MANHELDATGLTCPLPVLRARKALAGLAPGSLLEIRATDPATPKDFAAFCEATGHVLVDSSEANGIFRFLLRKAG